jgi:hypothetical protein
MPKIQDKMRSKLIWSLKFFVMLSGIAYLFWSIQASNSEFNLLSVNWQHKPKSLIYVLLIVIFGAFLNWFGEIKKWQTLVGDISFFESVKQSLVGHSLALFTPNKWGEYGGKCLFYPKHLYTKIIALTGVGHLSQLLMTLIFGGFGLWFGFKFFESFISIQFKWSWWILIFALLLGLAFYFKIVRQKVSAVFVNIRQVEKSKVKKAVFWSAFRYVVFAHQFLLLLWCFDADIGYVDGMSLIALTYLLSSVIPVFAIADVFVKGSIAVTLMSFLGLPTSVVLLTVFLMWIGNVMLPALGGFLSIGFSFKPFSIQKVKI